MTDALDTVPPVSIRGRCRQPATAPSDAVGPWVTVRDFNRHLFGLDAVPTVSKTLDIRHSGVVRPFAARYMLKAPGASVPAAAIADMFVPIIHMAPRSACNVFFEGKHIRRPATATGTVSIRDRRASSYADSPVIDNVSFYITFADLARLTDQAGERKIDEFPHLLDRAQDDPILYGLARTIKAVMEHTSEASQLFLDQMFNAVCYHVASTYGGMAWSARPYRGGLSARQEAMVKDLLHSDLGGNVSLAQLAAVCDLSERHFGRAFKQSMGVSPHQWLLQRRVDRAKSMLKETSMTISWLALDCGFASQSHFTRVFTKLVGSSPGAWRRAHQE